MLSSRGREKEILGTEVSIADAFRFKGALPEVANCRLAMLGASLIATLIAPCSSIGISALHPKLVPATFNTVHLQVLLECHHTDHSVADMMHNTRLSALPSAQASWAALGYEIIAHKSLAVQIKEAPLLIAATFLTFIIATLVRMPCHLSSQPALYSRGCSRGWCGQ